MKQFRICFEVREDRVALIMGLLTGEVSSFCVEETSHRSSAIRTKTPRNTAVSHTDLGKFILQQMKPNEEYSARDIGKVIALEGRYQASSSSPYLSGLVREGKVERLYNNSGTRDWRYRKK